MLSINISELIWTVINFFLLLFILKKFLFDPILKFTDARQAKIDAGLEAEREAEREVEANREALAEAKNETRAEAARLLSEAHSADEQRGAEVLTAARAEAKVALKAGQAALAADGEKERAALEAGTGALSAQLAAQLLGREE